MVRRSPRSSSCRIASPTTAAGPPYLSTLTIARLICTPRGDIFAKGIYTPAIWQATHENNFRGSLLSAVNMVKSAFVIRCGAALSFQERRFVNRSHNLMISSKEAGKEVPFREFSSPLDAFTSFLNAKVFELLNGQRGRRNTALLPCNASSWP